ncbi:MAG: type II toxin-antitoxin system RelE/ParE family toxin, partial [Spirochaetales bacterium]|nr:type II toxin-antitoxin system RelE/ParE family toxin [Spirochaetales bacterium]
VTVYVTVYCMKIKEYVREDNSNPYEKWFNSLDIQAAAKIAVAIARIELGNTSNIKWFGGIGECRINWGSGYRVYLAQDGKELIILFGGGTKKKQSSDIKKAKDLFEEYKIRKKRGKM